MGADESHLQGTVGVKIPDRLKKGRSAAGCQRQHDDKDALSNWRSPPRPSEKSLEQVRSITGITGKWQDGERVADGPV